MCVFFMYFCLFYYLTRYNTGIVGSIFIKNTVQQKGYFNVDKNHIYFASTLVKGLERVQFYLLKL